MVHFGRRSLVQFRRHTPVQFRPSLDTIRTIAVSPGPFGLVVDSATGRAFLNGTNSLQVLDIATGALLHRTTLPRAPNGGWPAQVVPDERDGRVFAIGQSLFGPGADQVAVLNATSGQQVRTLRYPAGAHTAQVVVDERRGRAYVLLTPTTGRTLTVRAYASAGSGATSKATAAAGCWLW